MELRVTPAHSSTRTAESDASRAQGQRGRRDRYAFMENNGSAGRNETGYVTEHAKRVHGVQIPVPVGIGLSYLEADDDPEDAQGIDCVDRSVQCCVTAGCDGDRSGGDRR